MARKSHANRLEVLYLPVVALGGVLAIVMCLRLIRQGRRDAVLAVMVGAGMWVIAQVLEFIQWDGDRRRMGCRAMMIAEELLELLGSCSFVLGAILVVTVETVRRSRALVGGAARP